MTEFVDWLLGVFGGVAADQPTDHPLYRVNRDTSQVYGTGDSIDMTQPISSRSESLEAANLVGVRSVSRSNSPSGTRFNYRTEQIASIRLEGMNVAKWGHIDPSGELAPTFQDLETEINNAVAEVRHHPDVDGSEIAHYDIRLTGWDYQLAEFRDFYRGECDVLLRGKQNLPDK